MIIILMGVAGSGKTTIGNLISKELGWKFIEGDHYHSAENLNKMSQGIPLDDEDRKPWLEKLRSILDEAARNNEDVILTCSALKEAYRRILISDPKISHVVYLKGTPDLLKKRLESRKGHFMPASLLLSQFTDLEEPPDALQIDAANDPGEIISKIRRGLSIKD
jgi:gluconokinase